MCSHRGGEPTRARECFGTVSLARRLTIETVARPILAAYSPAACRRMADFARSAPLPEREIRDLRAWHEQDAADNGIEPARSSPRLACANDRMRDRSRAVCVRATARDGGRARAGKAHVRPLDGH